MKRIKLLNQTGDTIIEVLIVLAILGLAFSISYATANHGLIQSRNAEEHSEALGIINSQIELVRAAFANKQDLTTETNSFCLPDAADTTHAPLFSGGFKAPSYTAATDSFTNYPTAPPGPYSCVMNTLYHVSITYYAPTSPTAQDSYFDFIVRWDGLGNLGRQQEEVTYRMDK